MNKLNKKQEKKESKYPYRCGICKAQFHYEQGFDGHMRKHKLGILNKKGLTNAEYKKGYWQNKLSLQRKEIIGEIEKKREESRIYLEDGNFLLKPEEVVIYKYALDQAMKTIKRGE